MTFLISCSWPEIPGASDNVLSISTMSDILCSPALNNLDKILYLYYLFMFYLLSF